MSNYGPKYLKLYSEVDNSRRKSNNTSDQIETVGQNKNVKSYSTKPGQLSASSQAWLLAKKQHELNKKQPVKQLSKMVCPVERAYFLSQLKRAA